MVYVRTPYSIEKNLGKSYNEAMRLIPDGDTAVFIDHDAMFLTPDAISLIHQATIQNPDCVLTGWVNRVHKDAENYYPYLDGTTDLISCIQAANILKHNTTLKQLNGSISGTLLVIPKHVWELHPFSEVNIYRPDEPNILGVDNEWTNRIRKNGVRILRMNNILMYHAYRAMDGSKQHLL